MAETDFTAFTNATNGALDAGDVSKGVINASGVGGAPAGGSTFVAGFNSLQAVTGFAGYYYSGANFNPVAGNRCGSIRAAIKRYASSSGYAPLIGWISGTNVQSSTAYMLGLSNSDPYQIVLKKGKPGDGLKATDSGVLRTSSNSYNSAQWLHLRLDIIVNPNGDVILNCYENDLLLNDVTSPSWTAISGMAMYVDDALAILSGSSPVVSGFRGIFGHYNDGVTGKTSLFDYFEIYRQTAP